MSPYLQAQMIVAHRGASHDAPENSLAAFRLAWEKKADAIEGDFRLTRDGQIVCIHDDTTERTAGENLVIADTDFKMLRKLDIGTWKGRQFAAERIPTLEEVIETVPTGRKIFIELKTGPEIVPPLKRVLDASKLTREQTVVIAFDERTVVAVKQNLPKVKVYWLTGFDKKQGLWGPDQNEVLNTLRRCQADGLGCKCEVEAFNRDFVESLRSNGYGDFHVWTVDDPKTARFYQSLQATAITTNRPDLIRRALNPSTDK